MEPFLILGLLVFLLLIRVPVAFALGTLGVGLLMWKGFPLISVPQRIYGTLDSFELLAVPMFLLCLLYPSDAADVMQCLDLGGRGVPSKKTGEEAARRVAT